MKLHGGHDRGVFSKTGSRCTTEQQRRGTTEANYKTRRDALSSLHLSRRLLSGHQYCYPVLTMAFPAIDHQGHPHIIDAIYKHAPRESLLALRAASKAHRDRVDALFSAHLVLEFVRPYNADGRANANSAPKIYIYGPRGRRLPAFWSWKAATPNFSNKAFSQCFKQTHILDVRDEVMIAKPYAAISHAMPSVHTLRALRQYESQMTPENMMEVKFRAPTFVQFSEGVRPTDPEHAQFVSYSCSISSVPVGTKRAVCVLQSDVRDPKSLYWILGDPFPASLKEMAIIFVPIQGPTPEKEGAYDYPTATLHAFNGIAVGVVENCTRVKFTLVGALDLHHRVLGFEEVEPDEDLKATLVDGMQYIAGQTLRGATVNKTKRALEQVKWMSLDQYRASIPKEQYDLEMVRSMIP